VCTHKHFLNKLREYKKENKVNSYFMLLWAGQGKYYINAEAFRNKSRFITHSCDPNAVVERVSLYLFNLKKNLKLKIKKLI
jgi:hypothetical protein